jgi:hypothetical protein
MAIVTTHVAAVQELYVAYFGRPADTAGLDYWTNVVEANAGATAAVSAAFAASPEYIVTYFGQTNTQIVNNIYQNLFGRDADAAGSAYWANLLTNGTIKVDTIVAEVANAALTTDAEAVENKVAASTAFTAQLDTTAENTGYAGNSALTLAKAFIKSVTTDATLATAITPANLTAQVAAVVKAGTPFTVTSGLAALETANDNLDDFLEDNNLPATATAAEVIVDGNVAAANVALDVLVAGTYYVAAPGTPVSTGIQAALLADQQRANNTELTNANAALTAANASAAGVVGLSAAIANVRSATAAAAEADTAADQTAEDYAVAASAFDLRTEAAVTIVRPTAGAATGFDVVTVAGANAAIPLIETNARGNLVLSAGVTEADYPGITALRDALIADIDAQADLVLANAAVTTANGEGVLTAGSNGAIVTAVNNANIRVENAEEAISDLSEAVADRTEAIATQTAFDAAVKATADASAAFTAAGFNTPVELNGTTAAATSGSDIFMLGDAETVTLSSFGRSGSDSLYVGTQFSLNTGTLESGNDSAMEVFFIQNGSRTEVYVEQAAYGSDSGAVTVITLVGVDATDLQLTNGIVSLKAGAMV